VLLEPGHQPVMIAPVENRLEVELYHPTIAVSDSRL
jgi:hypothetical protein